MGDPIVEKEDGFYYCDPSIQSIVYGPYASREEAESMLELHLQSGIESVEQ